MKQNLRKPASAGLGWPDASLRPSTLMPRAGKSGSSPSGTGVDVYPRHDVHGQALVAIIPNQADGNFEHRVQFYELDDHLFAVISGFLVDGLKKGEPLVVIATEAHRDGLSRRLQADGLDVTVLAASGKLVIRDARKTLDAFMVDGMPERELFRAEVGDLMNNLQSNGPEGRIRVYGEMVDLLWREGNARGTLALEALWNEVGQARQLSLLCGYHIGGFDQDCHSEPLIRVCNTHRQVSPTESYPASGDSDERLREIALLQQRARMLESEVEHRKRLEQVLQAALLQRRLVEDELRASQKELKNLEQALRRQNEDLSRTVRFSEMFVGILGHDLRNPLSAIATAASLLGRRADSDKVAKPAARIVNSAGRMGRMIDQLLDFTRIRLGEGIPIEQRQTDLAGICRLAIEEVEAIGDIPTIELRAAGDVVGWWDADRLQQLVSNLLSNAVVHGRAAESIVMRIDGTDGGRVVLQIQNTGVVPQPLLPLLFEPFRSGSNNKQEGSNGLGLGLFISQQIARAQDGSIEVSSCEEDGTRFTVTLPRHPRAPKAVFASAGDRT